MTTTVTIQETPVEVTVEEAEITANITEQTTEVTIQPGIGDHGGLAGLADDDHAQYLNTSRHGAIGSNPHGVTRADIGAALAHVVDTKANILASSPTAAAVAVSSDTDEFFFWDGAAWWKLDWKLYDAAVDLGYREANHDGYYPDTITDKYIANAVVQGSDREEDGSYRISGGEFQVYLNGVWNNIVINFRLREESGTLEFEHQPIGYEEWIEIMSGNAGDYDGLNGLPLIQQYGATVGAYGVPLRIDGGSF